MTREPFHKIAAGLATVAGLVSFGLLYYSYSYFYRQLGVSPTEVGLSYGTTLSNSWGLLVIMLAVLFPVYFINRLIKRFSDPWPLLDTILMLCLAFAVLVIAVASYVVGTKVQQRAEAVKEGRAVEPLRWGDMQFLDMRATAVTVHWIAGSPPSGVSLPDPVLLLGQQNAIDVLYTSKTGAVRVPAAQVVLVSVR
jgi:hypothetical protein